MKVTANALCCSMACARDGGEIRVRVDIRVEIRAFCRLHAVGSIHYSRCWFFNSWALPGHVASRGKGLQNKSLMRCEAMQHDNLVNSVV